MNFVLGLVTGVGICTAVVGFVFRYSRLEMRRAMEARGLPRAAKN